MPLPPVNSSKYHRSSLITHHLKSDSASLRPGGSSLIEYKSKYKEADQIRLAYVERNTTLARAFTAKEAALARAEDDSAALADRVGALEATRTSEKHAAEQKITELDAALRREKLDRAVVEGALATARRDFGKAMRDVMALTRNAAGPDEPSRAANAA